MKERREITAYVEFNILYDIDDLTVENGIALIQNKIKAFKKQNKQKWKGFKFNMENDGYDNGVSLQIMAYREETDEEIADREKAQDALFVAFRVQKEANELKEYKRLKNKFEKGAKK